MEDVVLESARPSPKVKVVKTSVRRRKRPLVHLRSQHLDDALLSPVTTPTDDEVIHRIKHAGVTGQMAGGHLKKYIYFFLHFLYFYRHSYKLLIHCRFLYTFIRYIHYIHCYTFPHIILC